MEQTDRPLQVQYPDQLPPAHPQTDQLLSLLAQAFSVSPVLDALLVSLQRSVYVPVCLERKSAGVDRLLHPDLRRFWLFVLLDLLAFHRSVRLLQVLLTHQQMRVFPHSGNPSHLHELTG